MENLSHKLILHPNKPHTYKHLPLQVHQLPIKHPPLQVCPTKPNQNLNMLPPLVSRHPGPKS